MEDSSTNGENGAQLLVPTGRTPIEYQELAIKALEAAGDAWQPIDSDRARRARWLAKDVAGEDPETQERVLAVLPGPDEPCHRSGTIAAAAGLSREEVRPVLEALRRRRLVATGGGWWRQAPAARSEGQR